MNSWLNEVTIEDITSERLREIAFTCGLSDVIILVTKLPGIDLYIPVHAKKMIDQKYAIDNYNGSNISSIAIHLGMDRCDVENIINKNDFEIGKKHVLCTYIIRLISKRCGYDVAARLIKNFAGERILVPRNAFHNFKRKYIEKNFNGSNIIDLALFLDVSENYVRKCIADMYSKKHIISLFDAA